MASVGGPIQRPGWLLVGVCLYVLTSLVGFYRVFVHASDPGVPREAGLIALPILFLLSAINFWLWAKVFAARNWARWVLIAFTALSWVMGDRDSFGTALLLIDTVAVGMLVLPATNEWFQTVEHERLARALLRHAPGRTPEAPSEPLP